MAQVRQHPSGYFALALRAIIPRPAGTGSGRIMDTPRTTPERTDRCDGAKGLWGW